MMAHQTLPAAAVLSVGYPLLPVSSDAAGGAEQILHLVERALVRAGHPSFVIAAAGSAVDGKLIETPAVGRTEITEEVRREAERQHLAAITRALRAHTVDLIHFHGLDFHSYIPADSVPKLATLHLPLDWYPPSIFNLDVHLNCVSRSQAASAPEAQRGLPVVENGVDVDAYRFNTRPRDSLLWIGRICPEKGVHIALAVAHRLDVPLIVAGPVHPYRDHQLYFHQHVEPLLDDRRVYIGAVGKQEKIDLLSRVRCLLVPSLAAETSSLVAMEALSSGTPVVAFRSGALPEVVEHERTGLIVDSEDEMAAAVTRIGEISPAVCRAAADARFRSERMASDYLRLYRTIVTSRKTAHAQ